MASNGVLLWLMFSLISIGNTALINVECRAEHVGKYGQHSLLQCVYKPSQDAEDAQLDWVEWKKDEQQILFIRLEKTVAVPGFSLAEPSGNAANRNVSLLITNTSVKHQGEYTCGVGTDSGDGLGYTSLRVTAKYNKPAVKFDPKTRTLICESDSGYPKGHLRWFDENRTEWTKSSKMEALETESGLFNLSSHLTLLTGSTFSTYTCLVFNASGGKEEEGTYTFDATQEAQDQEKGVNQATKIVAPLLVIGSLIIGLLLLSLLLYKRRSQLARRFSTRPIMSYPQPVSTTEPNDEKGEDQSHKDSQA
ncbi:CD276 antigen isoform X1 [Eleginops maclovinus]|uniref:CD276 antigen isoform X1 n=1 Tax=Eleginops maclovinus TaxID=56733 RepID=UPI003080B224